MIRFASLGSGSAGNSLLVQAGRTRVLVDCGFSVQETTLRMARLGVAPADLDAILVTHEHSDHIGSSAPLARRHRLPVYMTPGTRIAARDATYPRLHEFHAGHTMSIGDLQVEPFTVPHDAREPAQFVFTDGAVRLALLTDAGHVTAHMAACVDAVEGLLLECNHDPAMLATGPYPPALKRRVGGGYGHLPNHESERLLTLIDRGRLQHVVGMHLSERNNHPDLARRALANGLCCEPEDTVVATQADGFGWRELR
ncbi:MBL fold metallo-hydrolase [Thioalkalivibrio sp.]|uniref:MBL fold metallo-hydrolase n=1 Tax=Thioalkalivibrio sp. TaxID=2093813 RepID=UPI0012D5F689|nr:MBL fold metallo-hydrolase [Thioalkalivibrio sp.]TVP81020.1 MAG: MBL fold metallo-hydrolase [Thioalkalivibrio sp.]